MKIRISDIHLTGLALPEKTTNTNNQSNIDCGNLWQKFEKNEYFKKIPGKRTNEILAVYHDYEGDYTQPFSYFIGCKVNKDTVVPTGMDSLTIPAGTYHKVTAKGEMPDCIANTWETIWNSNLDRAYNTDFEIYDERSQNWNDAEVDIYISLK